MDGHLKGVRVIDLTAYLSGPFVSMNLAAMGAEVIKIERPKVGDPCRWNPPFAGPEGVSHENKTQNDLSLLYLKRNRCKKSVLSQPAGRSREGPAQAADRKRGYPSGKLRARQHGTARFRL